MILWSIASWVHKTKQIQLSYSYGILYHIVVTLVTNI